MKKTYKKPYVYVEKFEMSVSVAACGWVLTPDGHLKQDNTDDKIGQFVANSGGFASKEVCSFSVEEFGYYGANLIYGSF